MRDYTTAAAMLHTLDIQNIILLSNNPSKVKGLQENDIMIVERIPLQVPLNGHNQSYLQTKKDKLGHQLEL